MVPEVDVHRVLEWAGRRNRPELLDEVRLEVDVDSSSITILECRAPWTNTRWSRAPIARLRFTATTKEWSLCWRDGDLAFHRYDRTTPTTAIDDLLTEIDQDPTGIFWG